MLVWTLRIRHVAGVQEQHVVITGGEGDLGKVTAAEFRGGGARVSAPGRQELDVTQKTQVADFFVGRVVDLLICTAGLTEDGLLHRVSTDSWERIWRVNFEGARNCARAVIPEMRARGGGHIVFLSSHSAIKPPPGQVAYASAKRALLGLMQDLAREHGGANIRINTVLPGFLENRMTAAVSGPRKEAVREQHALGRFNQMENVARFLRFLHEEMPHTSGQWFQLDSRPTTF